LVNKKVADSVNHGAQIGDEINQEVVRAVTALQSADRVSQYAKQIVETVNYLGVVVDHCVSTENDSGNVKAALVSSAQRLADMDDFIPSVNVSKHTIGENHADGDNIELY